MLWVFTFLSKHLLPSHKIPNKAVTVFETYNEIIQRKEKQLFKLEIIILRTCSYIQIIIIKKKKTSRQSLNVRYLWGHKKKTLQKMNTLLLYRTICSHIWIFIIGFHDICANLKMCGSYRYISNKHKKKCFN